MDSERFYFFAPLDSAVEGAIALGSLVERPKYADQPINDPPVPIEDNNIIKPSTITDFELKMGSTVGGSAGLWADFLQPIIGVGGNASIDVKTIKDQTIKSDILETRWFRPSLKYINQSISDPEVKNWLAQKKPWFGATKIFMITGIKIAHNASFANKIIKERGTKFHFGVDGTNSGVPLKGGPEADLRNDMSREERFKTVEPFVMAYRMNELKIKSGEVSSNKPFTDGAALGTVRDSQGKEVELFVEGITESDFATENAVVHEDEDGKLCRFAHSR
jgi:hypothetical protein